jgi:hypothetical protein
MVLGFPGKRPSHSNTASSMPRRPAAFTQADLARAVRAAKQAGASEVVVKCKDGGELIIRISQSTASEIPLAPEEEVIL